MKAYFISGLGADSRVFWRIHLPAGFEPVYLDWIKPVKNESLHDYAMRLAENVKTNEPFVLIGLSMGGMIATEIARKYNARFVVLISSIPCSENLPFYFRTAGKLKLHRIVPISLLKSVSIAKRFFTAETKEDKVLLRQLIAATDPAFVRWAIEAIVHWKCDAFNGPYIHIHGTSDGILPIRYAKPTHPISKAGHLMVLTKAEEINAILRQALVGFFEEDAHV